MPFLRHLAAVVLPLTLLAACGGGSGGSTPVLTSVTVSASDGGTLRYGDNAVVLINGRNLDDVSFTFDPGPCTLSDSPLRGNDYVAYRSCWTGKVGSGTLRVSIDGGTSWVTFPFEIPQPQVTMRIVDGADFDREIVITLDPEAAPITVDNFLFYVETGWYDGVIFHRHSPEFVLQGGGYAEGVTTAAVPDLKPGTGIPIPLERGLSNLRLTVAMARTNAPNSATTQFFINLDDNDFLDTSNGGYAAFGTITGGADVVDAMVAAPCEAHPAFLGSSFECLPIPNLVIREARRSR